jgi:hypothetical protein
MDKLARCYHQSIDRLIDYLADGTLKVSPQRDKVDLSAAVVFFWLHIATAAGGSGRMPVVGQGKARDGEERFLHVVA